MIYANIEDVEARMDRVLSDEERERLEILLEDAATMIDAIAPRAGIDRKKLASCRMVVRALGDGDTAAAAFPMGASQGSMSALGYQQQWTLPAGAGAGELYIGKSEKQILGVGNKIGARSPLERMAEYAPHGHCDAHGACAGWH